MKSVPVILARVYIMEGSKLLNKTLSYLKDEIKIRGVSVFRAIEGFGDSGLHSSSLLDLSLNLPLIIEFFDEAEKVDAALKHLNEYIKPEHVVFWEAKANAQ